MHRVGVVVVLLVLVRRVQHFADAHALSLAHSLCGLTRSGGLALCELILGGGGFRPKRRLLQKSGPETEGEAEEQEDVALPRAWRQVWSHGVVGQA
jgi:hypothetical protein